MSAIRNLLSDPIATILAAIIAAIVIFLTTLYSAKRTAKSELAKFRLDWIEKLREDLSAFQSMAMQPGRRPHEEAEFYELGTRIELRLNPSEKAHKELVDHMYKMLAASSDTTLVKYSNNPVFVRLSQEILRAEWDKVKRELGGIM